jgi:hypothetical protein
MWLTLGLILEAESQHLPNLGCVLGSYGLGSHLVVPPTGNPPIVLGNKSQPNWDLKTQ